MATAGGIDRMKAADPATAYAAGVDSGRILAGPLVRAGGMPFESLEPSSQFTPRQPRCDSVSKSKFLRFAVMGDR